MFIRTFNLFACDAYIILTPYGSLVSKDVPHN